MTEDEPWAAACLRTEVGNLRAVWHTARSTDNLDVAAALVNSLWWPLWNRDLSECWNWALELAADPRIIGHPSAVCVMAAAAHTMMVRGRLEEAEVCARRGLELAGDRDSEGTRRCWMELAECDLFQGRFADAIARSVSIAIPGWEAVAFDTAAMNADLCREPRRRAPLQRARPVHHRQPLDTGGQPLREGRDRQRGR